ncbi:glycosyltransferase [Siccirubricoccus phaeus]|uniref:glycosyltransferase n=1 Tax=Siccirubricoccus phaeus TaxID=2595053 RepID=UPI00165C3EEA|nr:glycosyltransferase [Siccirubricoccus phaeus]
MHGVPRFSIIIPAFNAAATLGDCLDSAMAQQGSFEVLVVDDASLDSTARLAAARGARLLRRAVNGGPGLARNLGIAAAQGEWLVFLDADDVLAPDALARLGEFLDRPEQAGCDAVGFDWHELGRPPASGAGRAAAALAGGKPALLRRYLSLQTDGAVIHTAARRSLFAEHGLSFAGGLHEDVDLLFRLYWHARRVGCLDGVLYGKRRQPGSIVESVSPRHVEGFLRAWAAIGRFLQDQEPMAGDWRPAYRRGLVALLATRVREIDRLARPGEAGPLYTQLAAGWRRLLPLAEGLDLSAEGTRHFRIAREFLGIMAATPEVELAATVRAMLREMLARSLSCHDLHHAAFLGPDRLRTCCKRFFVDGERRGDVVLFEVAPGEAVTTARIAAAKQALHAAINRGEETPCTGCPFLEFRDWGEIAPLRLRTLSLEHHSVRDLQRGYCSETYYRGKGAAYDVPGLVHAMLADGALARDATMVWGGGEPVVDPAFVELAPRLAERLPAATQRVLSNAVTHSPALEELLAAGRVTLTTSLDAGTPEVFARPRGRDRLPRVIAHLRRYAAQRPEAVTLKYIFTEGNATLAEVRAFTALLAAEGLLQCNVQLSQDFHDEAVAEAALLPIAALHALLLQAGARVVFLDDLLRQRLIGLEEAALDRLRVALAAEGLTEAIIPPDHPELVIWGAGWQARHLLERASFFRHRRPAFLVDSTPAKINRDFLGLPVRPPRLLLETQHPVVIAAVQGYPAIHAEFLRLGLPPSRLVTRLLL